MTQRNDLYSRRSVLAAITSASASLASLSSGVAWGQSDERIVVSGASGNLGGLTVEALLARGVPASRLILVSRTTDALASYAERGASVRFGDFTQPESLPLAYRGGNRMLLISVGGIGDASATQLLSRAINAAKDVGVAHIAYTSYIGISRGDTAGRAADHQATETALRESGVAWTMLRNSIYMNRLVGEAARMIADGRAVIPPNESPIGYITREDCGRAAAAALTSPGFEGRALDLTGPDLIGVRDTARVATAVTGRSIEVVQGGADARPGFGRPAMAFTSTHFEELTGQPPTSLRELFEGNTDALLTPPPQRR